MTDNEIIKALEYCYGSNEGSCNDCPIFKHKDGCVTMNDALAVINRQKAEIEELKCTEKRELSDGCKSCQHNTVCYEIENLRCRNDFIWYQAESGCPHFQNDIKAEARKEFAERLKKSFHDNKTSIVSLVTVFRTINSLVEEMESESK